jgi:thiamine biosynthesis lipoprotein
MKRVFLCAAAAALTVSLSACGGSSSATSEIFAMDTVMDLTAYGDQGQAAIDDAVSAINRLDRALDRTRPESEVARLNSDGMLDVSQETYRLIRKAMEFSAATGGAFDITVAPVASAWGFTEDDFRVPGQAELSELLTHVGAAHIRPNDQRRGDGTYTVELDGGTAIDLGGIAKGYASDCVEAAFRQQGVSAGVVSLGGNVYVQGSSPDGDPWQVGIRDPLGDGSFLTLRLTDAYAITSGGYQRYFEQDGKTYHHILDPATGCPADSGLLSVTVVADANGPQDPSDGSCAPGSGTMCDAFSTALFVMGEDRAIDFWRGGGYDFDMVLVTQDHRVVITAGLADRFTGNQELEYTYEVIR